MRDNGEKDDAFAEAAHELGFLKAVGVESDLINGRENIENVR